MFVKSTDSVEAVAVSEDWEHGLAVTDTAAAEAIPEKPHNN